ETVSPLLGRCALVWFYASGLVNIIQHWSSFAEQLSARHLPLPPLFLVVGLILVVMGCFSLLFGYHTRHGAVMLFVLTVTATFALHDFWHYSDPAARAAQFSLFVRDFAICGGLLLMVGLGPGPFAIDNAPKGGKKR
ncbi:MAG TPA: DoxX family protein, partial [Rhizomicrobium sp.]|nr:DoxX family protein [Rhizomicrobium sp.]